MIDQIPLTARIVDPLHFVFVPETWEKALKPYKQAKWTHDPAAGNCPPDNYQIKQGHFLAFPQFKMTQCGVYAAHLYAVVKELAGACQQVQATLTVEGLTLETIGGEIRTRVTLKPRGLSIKDDPHHAVLQM